ncbi:MAG: (deoxy)nucleoside triphosphate pyrophosphohydrolase [Pseudomonadota bacterium]
MASILLVAAAALIDRDGRVLLAQRPLDGAQGGLWEFPGGKVNDGETPEQALVRELKEELDVDTQASCLAPVAFASHDSGAFHLLMPLFICRKWSGTAKPIVAKALKWVRPQALQSFDMPPADIPLAVQLRDML